MRYWMVITLLPALALAGELPDSARLSEEDDTLELHERVPATPLSRSELESLYLKSPMTLSNPGRLGTDAMRRDSRLMQPEILRRKRRQSRSIIQPERPEPEPKIPIPSLQVPLDQL